MASTDPDRIVEELLGNPRLYEEKAAEESAAWGKVFSNEKQIDKILKDYGIPSAPELGQAGCYIQTTVRKQLIRNRRKNDVVLIPVAAGVLYPFAFLPMMLRQLHPILAALAMAFSSVSVVGNSLRLRKVKI